METTIIKLEILSVRDLIDNIRGIDKGDKFEIGSGDNKHCFVRWISRNKYIDFLSEDRGLGFSITEDGDTAEFILYKTETNLNDMGKVHGCSQKKY